MDIDEPLLPRKRKALQRFEEGIAPAEFAKSPKDEYRRVFSECFDLAMMSICSRFDHAKRLQNLLECGATIV